MAGGLLTDFYELTMAASYLRHGMSGLATFSLFVRTLPSARGFLVAAGTESCCDWLEQFSFETDDLTYLASLRFDAEDLDAFSRLRFNGDVFGVPEGTIVFANEPILEVTAPIAQAQLVETYLLNRITMETTLASKAARCCLAASGAVELVEFGFRRTQGVDAGLAAARCSAMVGFTSTSNVAAARRYGLMPTGTMAHSYVEAFEDETRAFATFAGDYPERSTFLVDTYNTLSGVRRAIDVIRREGLEHHAAIRLDSGNLLELAVASRRLLDQAGLENVAIFVSGGLDEYDIARFVAARAPIDAVGIGTKLGTSSDAPALDSVYKLVAYDGRPVLKLSEGKATLPAPKQIFRAPGLVDSIGLRDEPVPIGSAALLQEFMRSGRRVRPPGTLADARARFELDRVQLPDDARRLIDPLPPSAGITPALADLTRKVEGEVSRAAKQGVPRPRGVT